MKHFFSTGAYPPGCTQRDVDRACEDPNDQCDECGGDRNHCECGWDEGAFLAELDWQARVGK